MEDESTSLANIKRNYTDLISSGLDSIMNTGLNEQREGIQKNLSVLNANFKDEKTKIFANALYIFINTATKENYMAYIPLLKDNIRLYNLL